MTLTRKGPVLVASTLLVALLCPLLALWPAAEPRDFIVPAFVIYPFAWLIMIPAVYHDWIGFIVALAQVPIYSLILWRGWQIGRLRSRATWLATDHAIAVAVAIWFYFLGMA